MKNIDKNEIIEILEDMSEGELLAIWNEYAIDNGYEAVYDMDEFNDICESMTADDIACKCFYGDFNPTHAYFTFDGYENFESSDSLSNLIDIDELANYIADNEEDFDNSDLQDYFCELEEDEDEEGNEE